MMAIKREQDDGDRPQAHPDGQECDGHPGPDQIELLLERKRPEVLEPRSQFRAEGTRS